MALSETMLAKLAGLKDRYEEVSGLLAEPDVMGDREKFTALSKEYTRCIQVRMFILKPNNVFGVFGI